MLSKKNAVETLILVCLAVVAVIYLANDPRWKNKHPRTLVGTQTILHNDTVYVLKTTLESLQYQPESREHGAPEPR
jgi:hypothetical protein